MKGVEQGKAGMYVWGNEIRVRRLGDELRVAGLMLTSDTQWKPSRDIFLAYRNAPRDWAANEFDTGQKVRTGKRSPHIQFANADTDKKLISFVNHFGPVVSSALKERWTKDGHLLLARQEMEELRNERLLFHSVLVLVAVLGSSREVEVERVVKCITQIASLVAHWPAQREREHLARRNKQDRQPSWYFGQQELRAITNEWASSTRDPSQFKDKAHAFFAMYDPIRSGHWIVCELLNAFGPTVFLWGEHGVEGPSLDLRYGIRPLLYYMVRRAYLRPGSVDMCANQQCRDLFEIERANQQFCNEICSRQQRQREYWKKAGSKLRRRRKKPNKASPRQKGV